MKLFILILSIVLVSACNQHKTNKINKSSIVVPVKLKLEGTQWKCEITENCVNVFEFKTNSSYIFHSCELDDTYGNYFFKQDTLILDEMGGIDDIKNDEHKITRKKYYILIKNNKLIHLKMYEWFNDKFELSNFKFDESIYYTRSAKFERE